ncbi:SpoIID/LytB domain-containing protein [Terriglobus sp.]|uniref:SpoIID/LytB domain-containing protein n=1 Tax=Terriglobus sp. TaxID=1889013 RepID=UPI003B001F98
MTVLLFRTEAVQRLQIRSPDAAVRLCGACPEQRGPFSLDVHLRGTSMLDGANKPLRRIELDGAANVSTEAGHRAVAAGHWMIDVDHDRLRVRIQISRERYVEAVLTAESGPNEPAESLKALAVTARSFAAAVPPRHEAGMLCDTTHCQALRLEPVPQSLREAVWNTSGETLWLHGKQVAAYFSQHCGGFTEDASVAWGGPTLSWLTAHSDAWCARVPSQWHTSLPEPDVRRALASEGFVFANPIQEIVATSRDRSGRVQQVKLHALDGTRTMPAATLRFALNRSLGWNQLRSDRYQVRRLGDRIVFDGSGFGHGVGLCQAGATAMASAGKGYRDILQAYFPGTAVRVRPQDAGWLGLPANGFTLRTLARDAALEAEAAHAFADARARWGSPLRAAPTLTVFPSTEAFRQATGQPGWELAATQGVRIAAQPKEVLRSHGGAGAVFRHEFLHSFVEAEASPTAPLWLREGFVAVLNGESCAPQTLASADSTDAALLEPVSLAQSQQAHAAACALTKRIIAEHGLSAAHAMLRKP